MKPKLETKQDVVKKDKAKKILEKSYNIKLLDLYEPLYIVDWVSNETESHPAYANCLTFIEFKARNYEHNTFSTLMLSLHKWMKLMSYHSEGFGAGLCVGWLDGLYYLEINRSLRTYITFKVGGRSDRSIEGDVEPCVFIPVTFFKKVEEPRST